VSIDGGAPGLSGRRRRLHCMSPRLGADRGLYLAVGAARSTLM
jgi:hypothetical protein